MGVVVIVAAVLVGVVLIVLLMRAFARRLYARRLEFEQQMIARGVETSATVTKAPGPPSGWTKNPGVWGVVTFAYTDSAGTERSVKRRVYMHQKGDVKIGDRTQVWYDPDAPHDVSRTVVAMEQRSRPVR